MLSTLLVSLVLLGVASAVPMPTNCGRPAVQPILSREEGDPRVIGGQEARPYSWPWQVQIRYNNGHFCGASILSNDWLLSASHCFYGMYPNGFTFRAARHTRDQSEQYEQIAYARQIYIHEYYNPSNFNNDIALVRLQSQFSFNSYVSPVCINREEPANNLQAWVTGWGLVKGTCCDGRLKQAMLPVIARQTCSSYGWWYGMISDAMVCAGYASGSPASCSGDSGGPLVTRGSDGTFRQVGVVSWGSQSCTDQYKPSVFANVNYFKNWITSKITAVEREEAEAKTRNFHPRLGAAFRDLAKSLEE